MKCPMHFFAVMSLLIVTGGIFTGCGSGNGDDDLYTISGTVVLDRVGYEGVSITLSGDATDATITDTTGYFSFGYLKDGNYTVTPAFAPQTFSPISRTVSVSEADVMNVNFFAPSIIWLVDIDSMAVSPDGYSWSKAFSHPQDAMDVAISGDQIWVAEGTYYPRGPEDTYVLSMADGVAVYGGFSEEECKLGQRDWEQNVTILDGNGFPYLYDDCHVVIANADNAVLDGFTVTGGNDREGFFESGNGIHISNPHPIISSFVNCTITRNIGTDSVPGILIQTSHDSEITFTRCEVSENWGVRSMVGGIAIRSGNVTFTECDISNNSVDEGMGGISIGFSNNVTIERTRIENNTCRSQGGPGGISSSGNLSLINSVVAGNSGAINGQGGGIRLGFGTNIILNSTIVNNHTLGDSDNSFGGGGLNIPELYNPVVQIRNSIFWGNTSSYMDTATGDYILTYDQIKGEPESVTYSDIMGGWAGTGNIDTEPYFLTDFSLSSFSPCIDAGTSDEAPLEDIEGTPRPQGAGYDMGAYEYIP